VEGSKTGEFETFAKTQGQDLKPFGKMIRKAEKAISIQ
jgi:hypothetical protein